MDVRREFVRKVGITRVFDQKARILDESGSYTLGEITMDRLHTRMYLKMLNFSLGDVWHVEAVHPDCTTVQEALTWRRYGSLAGPWNPERLT